VKVLVAYASKHGSTKGIAERISTTLSSAGLDATVRQVDEAGLLDAYDAFVVGSAAYMFHWLKEATAFVRRNRAVLASRPTWLFSSGPIGSDLVDKEGRDVMETSRPREFAEFEQAIHPRDERIFFGAYDPGAPPIGLAERFTRIMPAARAALPAGDFRDWPRIDAWAREIVAELRRGAAVGA
jgi:menaquinone-dependent protoporphyrinogen oxidase